MLIAARKSWLNWVNHDDDYDDVVVYGGKFILCDYILVSHNALGNVIFIHLGPSQIPDPWKVLDDKKDEFKDKVEKQVCLNIHQKPTLSISIEQNLIQYEVLELFKFLKPKCSCHNVHTVTICPHVFWRITLVKVWSDYLRSTATTKEWTFFEELNTSTPNCMYLGTMSHDKIMSLRNSVRIMFFNKPNLNKILNQVYKFFCQYLPKEIFWELEPGTPRYS